MSGVGVADAIDTAVAMLDVENTTSGAIRVVDAGVLEVTRVEQNANDTVAIGADTITVSGTGVSIAGVASNAAADIELTAATGLTLDAAVSNLNTNAGANISLQATAATGDVAINAPIAASAGAVSLDAGDSITLAAAGDITASGAGNVSLVADAAAGGNDGDVIDMDAGTVIDAGTGDIDVSAHGAVTLGSLTTTSISASAVSVTSLDAGILDANGTGMNVVAAGGTATLFAETGIGAANGIETEVQTLSVTNQASGAVEVLEADDLTLAGVAQSANEAITVSAEAITVTAPVVIGGTAVNVAADISLSGTEGITLQAAVTNNNLSGAADVLIDAATGAAGAADVTLSDAVSTAAGSVTIRANDSVSFLAGSSVVAAGSGTVQITGDADASGIGADNGQTIAMAAGTQVDGDLGNVTLVTAGTVTLAFVTADAANLNDVTITSSGGAIVDGDVDSSLDIAADGVTLTAATGIGDGNPIETAATAYTSVVNSSGGNVALVDQDAVTISTVEQTLGGNIDLSAAAITVDGIGAGVRVLDGANADAADTIVLTADALTVDGEVSTASDNAGADVTLTATGTSGLLSVNAVVSTALGDLDVTAADRISLGTAAQLTSGGAGALSLTADSDGSTLAGPDDSLVMADTASLDGGAGDVSLAAGSDITLANIVTTSTGAGAVSVNSAVGAIESAGGASTGINAAGGTLTLDAALGVGAIGALDLDAAVLVARNTGAGAINLAPGSDVVVNELSQTNDEPVTLMAAGALTVASAGVTIGAGTGEADLTLTAGATIDVNAAVDNNSTHADSQITVTAGGPDADINVSANVDAEGLITLSADDSIGLAGSTRVASVSGGVVVNADADATAGGDGGVVLMVDGAVIDGGSGAVVVNAQGDISVAGIMTTAVGAGALTLLTTTGAVLDAGDADTDLTAAAGGLDIDAVAGVGAGGNGVLETEVASVDVVNTTSGNIGLLEADALTVAGLTQQASGDIDVGTAAGTLTIDAAGTGVQIQDTAGADDTSSILLQAQGGDLIVDQVLTNDHANGAASITLIADGLIRLNAAVSTDGGDLVATADDLLDLTAAADLVAAGAGAINLTADDDGGSDGLFMADGAAADAGAGDLALTAAGEVTLGALTTTSAAGTAVTVTSTGAGIVDGATAPNIVAAAGTAVLDAQLGVGVASAIETDVAAVSIDNATAGTIAVTEANDLIVNRAHQQGTAGIDIQAAGSIDVAGAGTGVVIDGAGVTAATIAISTTDGDVTVGAEIRNDGADAGSGVSVTVGGTSRVLTLGETGTVTAAAGEIAISADSDITLGLLTTGSGSATAVTITSVQGSVVDGNTGLDVDAPAGTLVAVANTGVGSADPIETTVAALNVVNNTSGNVDIAETDNLLIDAVTLMEGSFINVSAGGLMEVTAAGTGVRILDGSHADPDADVTLTAGGGLLLNEVVQVLSDNAGADITLVATGSASDVTINAAITSAEGSVSVSADDAVNISATGSVLASGAGTLSILTDAESSTLGNDDGQAFFMATGATLDAGSGMLSVDSGGNATLGLVSSGSSSDTAIVIDAAGAIIDGGGAATDPDVAATGGGRITLRANDGVGAGDAIEGTAGSVVLDNATSGDIEYAEVGGALAIAEVVQREGGNITLTAETSVQILASGTGVRILDTGGNDPDSDISITALAGSVDVDGPVAQQSGSGGADVMLTALGLVSDVTTSAAISTAAGSVSITADDAVMVGGDITAAGLGNVTLLADVDALAGDDSGAITQSGLVDAGAGLIDLDAAGDISVASLTTTSGASNAVTIDTSAGAIVDAGDAATDIVAAGTAVLSAASGVGTGGLGALETTVGRLDVSTAAGDAFLADSGDLVLGTLSIVGDLSVTAAGNISDAAGTTVDVTGAATFDAGGQVVGTNDVHLDNPGHGFSTIAVLQAGDVTLIDENALELANITTGGTLDVSAQGAVTQTPATVLTTPGLRVTSIDPAGANITLTEANQADTVELATTTDGVTPATAAISYFDVDGFDVARITTSGTAGSLIRLTASGTVTQQDAAGNALVADSLRLSGTGSFELDNTANNVVTLAADAAGATQYADSDGFEVGTVDAVTGVTTADAPITLSSTTGDLALGASLAAGASSVTLQSGTGTVTQNAGTISGVGLELIGGAGSGAFAVTATGNDVDVIAADLDGALTFTDANDLSVGAAGVTTGVRSVTSVELVTMGTGSLTLTEAIDAASILLDAAQDLTQIAPGVVTTSNLAASAGGVVDLDAAVNQVANLGATAGTALSFNNGTDLAIVAVGAQTGATAGSTVTLSVDGNLSVEETVSSAGALDVSTDGDLSVQPGGSIRATGLSGDVTLVIDADSAGTNTLTVNGTIDADGVLSIIGAADLNDTVDVNTNLLTGGALSIADVQNVDIAGGVTISAGADLTVNSNVDAINFSGGSTEMVTIQTTGGDINLANLTDSTSTGVAVSSADSLTLAGADLSGADSVVHAFEADTATESSETLTINDPDVFTVGTLTLSSGGTGSADTLVINADIDATNTLVIDDFSLVTVDAAAARTIEARSITIIDDVGSIELAGGPNDVTFVTTSNPADPELGDINLAPLTTSVAGAAPSLIVAAEGNIGLASVDLAGTTDGSLTITVDAESDGANQLTAGAINNVATVDIQGTGGNDRVTLAAVTSTTGSVDVAQVDVLDVNGDLTSAGAISVTNAATVELEVATISAQGDITLTASGGVSVEGVGLVELRAGNEGDITVSNVVDAVDGGSTNLSLVAEGSITTDSVQLQDGALDGALTLSADSNNSGVETVLVGGAIGDVTSLTVSGSVNVDDSIRFAGAVATSAGNVTVSNALRVEVDAGIAAAGALQVSDVATLVVRAGNPVSAAGGVLNLDDNVAGIEIEGTGIVQFSTTGDNDVALANVQDGGDGAQTDLTVSSSGNLTIGLVDLNDGSLDGNVSIAFGTANRGVNTAVMAGEIQRIGTFELAGLGDDDFANINGDVTASGAVTLRNLGTAQLADSVDVSAAAVDAIDAVGTLLIGGASQLSVSTGDIRLLDVDATGGSVSLDAGPSDSIEINTLVGGGDLTIEDSNTTLFTGPIAAGVVTINDTSTSVTFADDATMASLSARLGGYSLSLLGSQTTITSTASFANTGGLTLGDGVGDVVLFSSGVSATAGQTNVFGSVRATGQSITFDALSLDGPSAIDSTNNGNNAGGQSLSLQADVAGNGHSLDLNSGTSGIITVAGAVDGVSNLTIVSSGGATFQQQMGATSPGAVTISATANGEEVAFQGSTALTSLTTAAGNYGITFAGVTNSIVSSVTFNNSGGVRIGDSAFSSMLFDGGATASLGTVELAGDIFTSADVLTFGSIELLDTTLIDTTNSGTSPAGAGLTTGAVAGAVVGGFTLDAGTAGLLTVTGTVDDLPVLTLRNSNGATFQEVDVTTVTIADTTDGQLVDFQGTAVIDTLNIGAEGYGVRFAGRDNRISDLVTFQNTGSLVFGDDSLDSIEFESGVIVNTATTIAGAVVTQGAPLSLESVSVVEAGTATLSTNGGDVVINGTVAGTDGGTTEALRIDALTGNVDLRNADVAGTATGLANLTILAASDVDYGAVTIDGALTQQGSTGTTTLNADVSVGSLELTGIDFDVAGAINAADTVVFDNSGTVTIAAGSVTSAADGFSAAGTLVLGDDIVTQTAAVALGDLRVAEGANVTIDTGGGAFTAAGTTTGTLGGLVETLTVAAVDASDTFRGDVTFVDVFGASGAASPTGLTQLDIISADVFSVAEVALDGDLNVGASGNVTFNAAVSLAGSVLSGDNFVFDNFDASGALGVVASGDVSQAPSTTLTVAGLLDVSAQNIELVSLSGSELVVAATDDASVVNDQALQVAGIVAGDLDLNADGDVSLRTGGFLQVDGNLTLQAEGVLIEDLRAAGTIIADNLLDDLDIVNNQATTLVGIVRGDVDVVASGDITDGATDSLIVVGDATFEITVAGLDIVLDNTSNAFGSFGAVVPGGTIILHEANDTVLTTVLAGAFELTSGGNVSDIAGGSIVISGEADIVAAAGVALGSDDRTFEVGALEVRAADVSLEETSADGLLLSELFATSLEISTSGPITSDSGGEINVSGAADLEAAGGTADIDLTLSDNRFGSLRIQGAQVRLDEDDDTILEDVDVESLELTSAGEIDATSGSIAVTGALTLDAGADQTVTLTGDNTFGVLSVLEGGVVTISESDAAGTELGDVIVNELHLGSDGDVTQLADSRIDTAVLDVQTPGSDITLGQDNILGDVSLRGDAVRINNAQVTRLGEVIAGSLVLTSAGRVSQQANDPQLNVTGAASIQSDADIELTSDNNDFGSIGLDGGLVELSERSATTLNDVTAVELEVTSAGNITDADGAAISVSDSSAFSTEDNSVTLDGGDNNYGELSVTADTATIVERDDTELSNLTITNTLTISSGGTLRNVGGQISVAAATLDAAGAILLSREIGPVSFERPVSLTSAGGMDVTLLADGDITLGVVTSAGNLTVDADNIDQSAGSTVEVAGNTDLSAEDDIELARASNNFEGLVRFDARSVNLNSAAGLNLTGDSSAETTLDLQAQDGISLGAGASVAAQTATVGLSTPGDVTIAAGATLNGGNTVIGAAGGAFSIGEGAVLQVADLTADVESAALLEGARVTAAVLTLDSAEGLVLGADAQLSAASATIDLGGIVSLGADSVLEARTGDLTIQSTSGGLAQADGSQVSAEGDATFDLGAALTQTADADIRVVGSVEIDAPDGVTLPGSNSLPTLSVATNAAAEINSDADVELVALDVQSLNLTAPRVSNADNASIEVAGDVVLNAGDISLTNPDGQARIDLAGAIEIGGTGTSAVLQLDSPALLGNVDASTLNLAATQIDQQPGTSVEVVDTVTLTTTGGVSLTEAGNTIPRLELSSGNATIVVDSDIVLQKITAARLTLTAEGLISQGDQSLDVADADLMSSNSDIRLNGDENDVDRLTLNGATVDFKDSDAVEFVGATEATSLNVTAGEISQAQGASVTAANATLDTTGAISLGSDSNALGAVTLTAAGQQVTVTDSDALTLEAVTASDLTVNAGGTVIATTGNITVTGTTLVNAPSAAEVTIGGGPNQQVNIANLGISAATADVSVQDDDLDGLVLTNLNVGSFAVEAAGMVTDSGDLTVSGDLDITAVGVTLDDENSFGDVRIQSDGDVRLHETDGLTIDSIDGAEVVLSAGGDVTLREGDGISATSALEVRSEDGDIAAGAARVSVTNGDGARFIATGNAITLTHADNVFGDLELDGGAVHVVENDTVRLAGVRAETLVVEGGDNDIVSSTALNLEVQGAATFLTTGSVGLEAVGADQVVELGSLQIGSDTITVAEVDVVEDDATTLARIIHERAD